MFYEFLRNNLCIVVFIQISRGCFYDSAGKQTNLPGDSESLLRTIVSILNSPSTPCLFFHRSNLRSVIALKTLLSQIPTSQVLSKLASL